MEAGAELAGDAWAEVGEETGHDGEVGDENAGGYLSHTRCWVSRRDLRSAWLLEQRGKLRTCIGQRPPMRRLNPGCRYSRYSNRAEPQ